MLQCIERESMSTTTLNMYTVAATIPLTTPTNTISFPIAYHYYHSTTIASTFMLSKPVLSPSRPVTLALKKTGQKPSKVKHSANGLSLFDFWELLHYFQEAKTEPCHWGLETTSQRDGRGDITVECPFIVVSSQNDTHLKKYLWRGTMERWQWNSVMCGTVTRKI